MGSLGKVSSGERGRPPDRGIGRPTSPLITVRVVMAGMVIAGRVLAAGGVEVVESLAMTTGDCVCRGSSWRLKAGDCWHGGGSSAGAHHSGVA